MLLKGHRLLARKLRRFAIYGAIGGLVGFGASMAYIQLGST
jgi:hypothetical protein